MPGGYQTRKYFESAPLNLKVVVAFKISPASYLYDLKAPSHHPVVWRAAFEADYPVGNAAKLHVGAFRGPVINQHHRALAVSKVFFERESAFDSAAGSARADEVRKANLQPPSRDS